MLTDRLNYNRLAQAQAFYKGKGYQCVETPWLVSPQAVRATLPMQEAMMETIRGILVNGGEQSFIQKIMEGSIEPGKYQTVVPCFQATSPHGNSMKLDLIWYQPETIQVAYQTLLNDALECFFEVSDAETFGAVATESGYNVEFNGVVIGSYGVRKMDANEKNHLWVYGTGLAEPKFSVAMHSLTAGEPIDESHTHDGHTHTHTHTAAASKSYPERTPGAATLLGEPE